MQSCPERTWIVVIPWMEVFTISSCEVRMAPSNPALPRESRSQECVMSRALFLGTLGTLLFAGPSLGVSSAQNKPAPVPTFLEGSEMTLEMSYSCPSNTACSFACPSGVASGAAGAAGGSGAAGGPGAGGGPAAAGGLGAVGGFFGADHVTKLTIYLGTMPLGKGGDAPVLFYEFSTRERPNSSGFSINAGLSATSCQVNGLTLDYSGHPP